MKKAVGQMLSLFEILQYDMHMHNFPSLAKMWQKCMYSPVSQYKSRQDFLCHWVQVFRLLGTVIMSSHDYGPVNVYENIRGYEHNLLI